MEKKSVISKKNFPHPPPFLAFVVGWLALDHWGAPSWAYGVGGTFAAIWLLNWILHRWHLETEVDLFDKKTNP